MTVIVVIFLLVMLLGLVVKLTFWQLKVLGVDILEMVKIDKKEWDHYLYERYLHQLRLAMFRVQRFLEQKFSAHQNPEIEEIHAKILEIMGQREVEFEVCLKDHILVIWTTRELEGVGLHHTNEISIEDVPCDILVELRDLQRAVFLHRKER